METRNDPDDDTVISSGEVSDRTVITASAFGDAENTVVESTARELDEKTRATQRRVLNTTSGSNPGARVAFAPQQNRERYAVRSGDPSLPLLPRAAVSEPVARPVAKPVRRRSGELVVAVVIAVTLATAGAVGGILALIFRG